MLFDGIVDVVVVALAIVAKAECAACSLLLSHVRLLLPAGKLITDGTLLTTLFIVLLSDILPPIFFGSVYVTLFCSG